jgi:hypothetical protein
MNEIKIAENKNVTFNNVISRVLEGIDEETIQKAAKMFESYLKKENLKPYGPLIVRETTKLMGREASHDSELLIQLREAPQEVANPYSLTPKIRLENALMARYVGPIDKMQMAYSKMHVYAFEHDITLGSVFYTVLNHDEEGRDFTADIFNEVI